MRRWQRIALGLAVAAPVAVTLLSPSRDQDTYVYSARGYTKLIETVFIPENFLEYTANFDSDELPMVRLAPQAERIERWETSIRVLRKASLQSWYDSFFVALRSASIKPAESTVLSVA